MRLKSISVRGFRGFNDAQTLDLSDPLTIFEGPNGSGKTSIGEAVEWLLYGRTLKRIKGEELSRREYNDCYKNIHFNGPGLPYVEAVLDDNGGKERKIRRELKADESSVLTVDGAASSDLKEFGVDNVHDRPLILQHTLQDFIFMKPKARYEVLSAMLGLEPLIALRNAAEGARTEYSKKIPTRAANAQSRVSLLIADIRQEGVLVPIATAVDSGKLADGRQHLDQVASGLVPAGTKPEETLNALKSEKAAKERAQLDWGRFAAQVMNSPTTTAAVIQIQGLEQRLEGIRQHLQEAVETTEPAAAPEREQNPQRRHFYELGLGLLDETHPGACPFCGADSLTAERVAALRAAVAESPHAQSAIDQAHTALREFRTALAAQVGEVRRLMPNQPNDDDAVKTRTIAGEDARAYLDSSDALTGQLKRYGRAFEIVDTSYKAIDAALTSGTVSEDGDGLEAALAKYKAEVIALPAFINAYAATYNQLDPTIRARLASAADVKKLDRVIKALEQWNDVRIAQAVRDIDQTFVAFIDEIRALIKKKQQQVLASRDQEINDWYAMLNPASDVGYDGMNPTTDNLELRARTYKKTMFAAPNLSTSQLNCVGLAVYLACATRPGTPFKTLLIDDPVQSMDDEHTEAFKKQVIAKLLDDDFHVVLLTHMQMLANGIELLYRRRNAALYKMRDYSRSGPSIDYKGTGLGRLLEVVRAHKDATNEEYRKTATLNLRMFVEQFVKELYEVDTGKQLAKKYEDKSWGELKALLKFCTSFDINDEAKLQDTSDFTSTHLHTDPRVARTIASSGHLNAHYTEMSTLLKKYEKLLGF